MENQGAQTAGAQLKCVSRTAKVIRSVDWSDSGHNEQRWRCKWEKRGGPPLPVCVDSRVPSAPWNAKVAFAWPEAKQDTQRARRAGCKPPGGVALHGAQSLPA